MVAETDAIIITCTGTDTATSHTGTDTATATTDTGTGTCFGGDACGSFPNEEPPNLRDSFRNEVVVQKGPSGRCL
jgi:hypothetical protein